MQDQHTQQTKTCIKMSHSSPIFLEKLLYIQNIILKSIPMKLLYQTLNS